jgi:hypothetical protein
MFSGENADQEADKCQQPWRFNEGVSRVSCLHKDRVDCSPWGTKIDFPEEAIPEIRQRCLRTWSLLLTKGLVSK